MLAWSTPARGAEPPALLEAERAFALSVQARDAGAVTARFAIAEGYYLYRDRLRFTLAEGTLIAPELPPGKTKEDPYFGKVEIYRGAVAVDLKFDHGDRGGETVSLVVESQGCADLGVCYPPQRQTVAVTLPRAGARPGPPVDAAPRKKSWFN
jgi:thiol:disulfide interchange protein DsbD